MWKTMLAMVQKHSLRAGVIRAQPGVGNHSFAAAHKLVFVGSAFAIKRIDTKSYICATTGNRGFWQALGDDQFVGTR
jgi:hypothetical protein